jgi:O-6-methylguanine DNA methyltransferase
MPRRHVGWGHTTTYGALAMELGAGPEAARDVGQAMARNPVALIIPCHRVLAAGGKVGGFSAPGGSAAKVRMLELEGVRVEPPRPAQPAHRLRRIDGENLANEEPSVSIIMYCEQLFHSSAAAPSEISRGRLGGLRKRC